MDDVACEFARATVGSKGWFTLATEATEAESKAESESEESSDLVWIATMEAES